MKTLKGCLERRLGKLLYWARLGLLKNESGVNDHEEPPVPIPNTEVKLMSVDNTWLETAWEDRSMPGPFLSKKKPILLVSSLKFSIHFKCFFVL